MFFYSQIYRKNPTKQQQNQGYPSAGIVFAEYMLSGQKYKLLAYNKLFKRGHVNRLS